MKYSVALAALLPAVALAAPLDAVFADGPDKNQITISSVSHSGNGCPQGTVSTTISQDKTVVTLGFDGFQTYIGPGTTPQDKTKNCQIHLNLKYPAGFSFAVIDSTYHGYAELETSAVKASFFSTYYFSQDAAKTSTTRTEISGGGVWASGQVYTKSDTVPSPSVVRSPCGTTAILNINNRIALTSSDSKASGAVTNDDATVALNQQVHIAWYTC